MIVPVPRHRDASDDTLVDAPTFRPWSLRVRLAVALALLYLPQLWLFFGVSTGGDHWWSVVRLFPCLPGIWALIPVRAVYETHLTEVLGMAIGTLLPLALGVWGMGRPSRRAAGAAVALLALYGTAVSFMAHGLYAM